MFDKFSSITHILSSYFKAYKGRNKRGDVILYKQNQENNLLKLREDIVSFSYVHKPYNCFIVNDSKKRIINAPSFVDHILHHSVHSLLEDMFEPRFIFNSYANRQDKGSHKAVLNLQKESQKRIENWDGSVEKYQYFLKMDITKYFPSVDQEILFNQIKRCVKDEKFLFFVKMIINSYQENRDLGIGIRETLNSHLSSQFPKGMPIGNVTSQLFANIYLHDLDFFVEHSLKPAIRKKGRDLFYIRYVDDFVFLAKEKKDLLKIRDLVLKFLKVKLQLHVAPRKMSLNRIGNGISFLGYVILPNRLKIRNDTIRRFKRKVRKYSFEKKLNSLISFKGHLDLANSNLLHSLSTSIFGPYLTSKNLTENEHNLLKKAVYSLMKTNL